MDDEEDRKIILTSSFKQIFQMMWQFEINPWWRGWVPRVLLGRGYLFLLREKIITSGACKTYLIKGLYRNIFYLLIFKMSCFVYLSINDITFFFSWLFFCYLYVFIWAKTVTFLLILIVLDTVITCTFRRNI